MIRCEQKGPHQQVRFRLSLSVLPTAPGITSLARPAHSLPPRALPSAVQGGWAPPGGRRGSGHRPGITPAPQHSPHLPQSQDGWALTMARSSWSCPLTQDPAPSPWSHLIFSLGPSGTLKTLPGNRRPAQTLGSQAKPRPPPWHSLCNKKAPCRLSGGVLGWRGVTNCSFLLPQAWPLSS